MGPFVLVAFLAAALPLKLWWLPDARAAAVSDDAVRSGLRDFLAGSGFSARIEEAMVGLPAVSGARGECRVLLANVSAQGFHQDLIASLAGPGDAVSFLFRGRTYPTQPGWATWASRLLGHLRLAPAAPSGAGSERVYAVLAVGPCGIDTARWAEQLDQPAL